MYKYGVVSTASITKRFIDGLRLAGDEVIAIASRDIEQAKKVAEELNIAKAYGSYEEVYNDPEVDIVYIPVINYLHYECAKKALEAHKHVVLEKPFTRLSKEAKELVEIARNNHVFFFEGVKNIFMPSTKFIMHHLEEIGKVNYISTHQGTKVPFPNNHWMYDISKGGGAYYGSCAYVYHYLMYLFNEKVTDLKGNYKPSMINSDVNCTFSFKLGDILVSSTIIMDGDMDNMTIINGELGRIEIDHFWRSHDVKVILYDGSTHEFHDAGNEFVYECKHIQGCLNEELYESPFIPLDRSVEVVGYIEDLYRQWGLLDA